MLYHIHRKKLGDLFLKWCKDTGAANVPMNVVAFLQLKGLINEDAALQFIKDDQIQRYINTPVEVDPNV